MIINLNNSADFQLANARSLLLVIIYAFSILFINVYNSEYHFSHIR